MIWENYFLQAKKYIKIQGQTVFLASQKVYKNPKYMHWKKGSEAAILTTETVGVHQTK